MKMLMDFFRLLRLLPALVMTTIAALCWASLERRSERRDKEEEEEDR